MIACETIKEGGERRLSRVELLTARETCDPVLPMSAKRNLGTGRNNQELAEGSFIPRLLASPGFVLLFTSPTSRLPTRLYLIGADPAQPVQPPERQLTEKDSPYLWTTQ